MDRNENEKSNYNKVYFNLTCSIRPGKQKPDTRNSNAIFGRAAKLSVQLNLTRFIKKMCKLCSFSSDFDFHSTGVYRIIVHAIALGEHCNYNNKCGAKCTCRNLVATTTATTTTKIKMCMLRFARSKGYIRLFSCA